ncbi:LexA family transcriptional regulator [Fulvimarina sp. 2208YS6-2-32]|uniref:LexA family transcriptional regulator n=1 Tax=Fulvimarina uroteuthidis TaxID=3098149 RepID=A0ABU5HYZ0_9HYPH|nr:LexA family transcriptional regulator [Fulvimarina sp. 2208YS6-2-32]MDY8108292.1 LexA family transcriptional regulator [Fulvimarina sp. 2208YS6-2-32]
MENFHLTDQTCQMGALLIRDFREAAHLTLEALAGDAEISVSQLSRIERDERVARIDELQRIAGRLKVSVGALVGEPTPTLVPLVTWISAGTMTKADGVMPSKIERHVPVANLGRGDWIALEVMGDSMNRIAPEGSVIIVNRADETLVSDRFYVFALEDGSATFKQWRREPRPMLRPYSTNLDHLAIPADVDDVYVVGRVRKVVTDI